MAKMRMAIVYRELSNIINHGGIEKGVQYYVVEPESGKKQVLARGENGVMAFVDSNAVINAILKYCVETQEWEDLTHRQAVECMKFWMAITHPISMPPYLAEKDHVGFCFQRLPMNYSDEPKPTPVIDEFLARCTNRDAFEMFIGSIFVENSSRYQYLWLYGAGGEGKGCFGRALSRLIGPGATTMVVPKTDSQKQFLAFSLQGKRLCIFPECSNFTFPNDPLFKQFTGHDDVWVEQKGKQGHNAPINAKFIFFSNERAGVAGTDANTRRLIYSEIGKPTVKYSTQIYDSLLAEEMPSFVIKCRAKYLANCPMGEDIPFEDEVTRQLLEFNDEPYQILTEEWLHIGAELSASPKELRAIKDIKRLSTSEYRNWIEYLRRNHGIECMVTREGSKVFRKWIGVGCKEPTTVLRNGNVT